MLTPQTAHFSTFVRNQQSYEFLEAYVLKISKLYYCWVMGFLLKSTFIIYLKALACANFQSNFILVTYSLPLLLSKGSVIKLKNH